jgi:hypothetical protein
MEISERSSGIKMVGIISFTKKFSGKIKNPEPRGEDWRPGSLTNQMKKLTVVFLTQLLIRRSR